MTKLVTLVAAVGLTAAAACGSSPNGARVVTRSEAETGSTRTARVSMTERIASASGPLAAGRPLQFDGAIDLASRQATFRVTTETGSLDAVIDGPVVYERIPQLASAVGPRTWLKIDLRTVGRVAGVPGLSTIVQAQPADPTLILAYLRGVSGRVSAAGHASVRGVVTTRYRVTVDLNRAAAGLGPDQQAVLRQMIDALGLQPTLPLDVWIDAKDRVRRVHLVQSYVPGGAAAGASAGIPNSPGATPSGSVELTMELFDFGTSVSVQPPPADEVTDIADLVTRAR